MEPFITKIGEQGVSNLLKTIHSALKKIGNVAYTEIRIRKATENYAENYVRRFCFIKILGMTEPVPLQNLYTEVQIVSPKYRHENSIIDELAEDFRKSQRNFGSKLSRVSGIRMANDKSKLNVLGAPGSGKSTFLRKIGLECMMNYSYPVAERYVHSCIPILIELKRLRNEPIDLSELIQKEFEIADFPDSKRFLDRALHEGLLLIILDGLDEVPRSKLDHVLDHIKDFTDKFHKNRFITSCRTAYYQGYLSGFTDVEICDFNTGQIRQFIRNWFVKEPVSDDAAETAFQNLLFNENNEPTLELARTPLLLAFLCMSFDESQRLPSNRSSLYRHALMILMQKWAAEKRIHNEDIYQDLHLELETEMLADIAASFYKDEKIFFEGATLKKKIEAFLSKRMAENRIDIAKVLEAIEIQQGILVERSYDIYSFSHLTIQEYLTAHYYNSPLRVHDLVAKELLNPKWREVFLLLTGIGDPNDTLIIMTEFLQQYAASNGLLSKVSAWVREKVVTTKDIHSDAAKKVLMASLLVRYKRYDTNYWGREDRLEMHADNLLSKLTVRADGGFSYKLRPNIGPKEAIRVLEQVSKWMKPIQQLPAIKERLSLMVPERPLNTMIHGSRQAYRRKILNELYTVLSVPPEICNLRRNLYEPLIRYMDGYALLIECASSSGLTSKAVWGKVVKNVFA